jgi:TRAP-type transport system small permease protein
VLDRIRQFIALVSAVCLAGMAVFTMADAIGRYFFNAPLAGTIEYIGYMLGVLIVAAYGLVTDEDGHITVGIASDFLPEGYRRVEAIFTGIVTVAGCGVVVWLIVKQATSYGRSGRRGETTDLPLEWLAYGLAALATIALIFSINLLLRPKVRSNSPQD